MYISDRVEASLQPEIFGDLALSGKLDDRSIENLPQKHGPETPSLSGAKRQVPDISRKSYI